MAFDASELLGAPQVAGVKVTPIGSARQRARVAGAGVGMIPAEIAGKLLFGKKSKTLKGNQTPSIGRLGFLAVTETELALMNTKTHGLTGALNQVVARVPQSNVASAEISGAMIGKLVINFKDGTQWAFETPPQNKKDARALVELVTSGVGSAMQKAG
jgi:hypothetical protein